MAVKIFRPTSPGTRFKSQVARTEGSTNAPHKPLLDVKQRTGGRDNRGLLAIRHRGGGHKRRYRIIDFRRDKWNVPGKVETIEYDPNRTANIALVCYADGERRYILAPAGLAVGAKILATSGLSFLGLGTQPPTADWGSMLATGRQFVILRPHVVLLPGLAIFAMVLALNLVGDALRDLLDPRTRAA